MADKLRDIPYLKTRAYVNRRRFAEAASHLLTITAKLGSPFLTALIIKALCIRVQSGGTSEGRVRSLVMLPKAGLTEDVVASLGGEAGFDIVALDRTLPKGVFKAFLPHIRDDNCYIGDPVVERDFSAEEAAKERLRAFWVKTLEHLNRLMPIDGFITGNFSYHAEREFGAAAEELGIPFLVLHKECRKTPRLADFYAEVYETRKGPFKGRAVMTYNHIEKDIQVRAGVMPEEKYYVTGMPRMDYVHARRRREAIGAEDLRSSAQHRPQLLFFSVFAHYALPFIRRVVDGKAFDEQLPERWSTMNWGPLMRDCHLAMVDLARDNPGIDVLIKTKGDPVAADNIREMFGKLVDMPKNLQVIAGGDPLDLIFSSHVVCGFNTTALVEAIAADVPIVVPAFQAATDPSMAGFIMQFGDAVEYAGNVDALKTQLMAYLNADPQKPRPDLEEEQVRILEHWTGNGDGDAGSRVRDRLIALMDEPAA